MKRVKKSLYYSIRYPMNVFQKEAHYKATERTQEYFKNKRGWKITKAQVNQVLNVIHIYIVYLARNMHKRKDKGYYSVSKVKIGYFRTIFTVLFIDMLKSGEFTKEEFKIIRNEFYKEEFDTHYRIIKQQKEWVKKKKLEKKLKDN